MNLLEEYYQSHDSSVEPATINVEVEEVKYEKTDKNNEEEKSE